MFIGEYSHTIDAKGRIAIPVKFRHQLSGGAVVTRGLDQCLFLYPKEEWEQLAGRLASLPLAQAQARAFVRLMLSGAMEVELDKQGRMVLPAYLRTYAQLKTNAVITGLYNRVEVWDEQSWKKYRESSEQDSTSIAEQLGSLGI